MGTHRGKLVGDRSPRSQNGPERGEMYRHYKGRLYTVIAFAITEEDLELFVIYKSNYNGVIWSISLDKWNEIIKHDGVMVPRFTRVMNSSPDCRGI